MDSRDQKAREMAARLNISEREHDWSVPSETKPNKVYRVTKGEPRTCTCEDFRLRQEPCKHILAVKYRTEGVGRSADTRQVEVQPEGRRYKAQKKRNWRAYNEAQVRQREHFHALLRDLCDNCTPAFRQKVGRRRMAWADIVFLTADKVYSTLSTRRYMHDCYKLLEERNLTRSLHYNTLSRHLGHPDLTPILVNLIETSASPLRTFETEFSIDATGISRSRFRRWFHERDQVMREEQDWLKLHLICGNRTNVVASVIVTERNEADATYLPELLNRVAKHFRVRALCGDKAYSSWDNLKAVDEVGGVPFIPFRDNATPDRGGIWRKMYFFYQYRREEFLRRYHQRSCIESTFASIKALFGDRVMSKSDTAMRNEILLKVLCHNIVTVTRSHYELGIEMEFSAPKPEPGSAA
jgi:transposase